ncbi:hypothetical protein PR048_027339 [Dryococelus australis]|uniref:Uncharacterized protein n=1 Tax=Dryococelus australis TaxID=614101 RepID=A0ABQ9GF74_9NEOP|nr:hypothetical protein PR048_027339 [Dryococelus australis]
MDWLQVMYGNQLQPDQLRAALGGGDTQQMPPQPPPTTPQTTLHHHQQRVMVRRVTRSSPDSDDTYPGEEPEEDFSMRDDQFLVSDRSENKFYGTVHGGGSGGGGSGGGGVAGAVGPSLGYIGRRLQFQSTAQGKPIVHIKTFVWCGVVMVELYAFNVKKLRKLNTISAYTSQKAKSKYRNRVWLERASQKKSSDTHETPYDRVKRCRGRKINIKASERANVDAFTQNKRLLSLVICIMMVYASVGMMTVIWCQQAATYLCPAIFPWVDTGPATEQSGMFVMKMVALLYLLIVIFDLIVVCGMGSMNSATIFFLVLFLLLIVAVLLVISRKPQNRSA